jgi:Flp pilus assembly protein CpaB
MQAHTLAASRAEGIADEEGTARLIRRRRTLPGGRAVTGGFLVALAAVGVFAASSHARADHRQNYVVARHALLVGTRLRPSDLTVSAMQLPPALAARRAYHRVAQVVGSVVVGPIGAGELVQASALTAHDGPTGQRQVSLPIDAARAVGGRLVPGDIVDIAATLGTGGDAKTSWIVRGATVIAADGQSGSLGDRSHQVVTLALGRADDALAVANAIAAGQVSLVRTTEAGR